MIRPGETVNHDFVVRGRASSCETVARGICVTDGWLGTAGPRQRPSGNALWKNDSRWQVENLPHKCQVGNLTPRVNHREMESRADYCGGRSLARHNEFRDQHLHNLAELIAGFTADRGDATIRTSSRRPDVDNLALDV